jgi:hypothetical protein
MKTFYTVDHNFGGIIGTATFRTKKEAMDFYNRTERVDKPVAHVCKKKETIDMFEEAASMWEF